MRTGRSVPPGEEGRAARASGVLLAPLPDQCKWARTAMSAARITASSSVGFLKSIQSGQPEPERPFRAMRIALFEPDIPQNTGAILRLAACLGVEAHIVEPAGFPTSDRAFRRAGMDYLDRVTIVRHADWAAFEEWRRTEGARLILFTTRAGTSYLDHAFRPGDVLLFGREFLRRSGEGASSRRCPPDRPHAGRAAIDQRGHDRGDGGGGGIASVQRTLPRPARTDRRSRGLKGNRHEKREHVGKAARGESRSISRPWALPLTRLARCASPPVACNIPMQARGDATLPNIPHGAQGYAKQWQKKVRGENIPWSILRRKPAPGCIHIDSPFSAKPATKQRNQARSEFQ